MGAQFIKGKTYNNLTWVMVDGTDFATPERALSAATKIKIYGKLNSASNVNLVSSGTGSLTTDIKHVGASALGIYTIALAKADLSDASAAWYDQYIISLSATGAAYQTLIVDGGIWISDLSAIASDIRSDVSDMHSDLIVMSGILSDTYSAVLLAQSLASDAHSAAVVAQALTASDMSDIASRVWSAKYTGHSVASSFGSLFSDIYSRVVVIQSAASDTLSAVLLTQSLASDAHSAAVVAQSISASDMSDLRSAISGGPAATVTASDISDIASAVWAFTTRKLTSNIGLNSSDMSDIRSAIAAGPAATITASDISDIASAVWAHTIGARVDSRILVAQSFLSDIRSDVSDMHSDLLVMSGILSDTYSAVLLAQSLASDAHSAAVVAQGLSASDLSDIRSAIAGITATISASDMSDIASRVWSAKYNANSVASSFGSLFEKMASSVSDLDSRISSTPSTKSAVASATYALMASQLSDILSAATQVNSRVLVAQSQVSDIDSMLTAMSGILSDTYSAAIVIQSMVSDVDSALSSQFTAGQQLNASTLSDIRSAIAAGPAATVTASDISDIASAVWANTIGARVDSRVRLIQSNASDAVSMLALVSSDTSDILSQLNAVGVQLNASTLSDIRSAIAAGPAATVTASDISDIASAVWSFTTRKLTSNISLNASDMSDIRSAITAGGGAATISASDISDIASAVRAGIVSDLSDILSAAQQANSRALAIQSLASDIDSALSSQFTAGVQLNASSLSDIRSAVTAATLTASQVKVQIVNALSVDTYAEPGQGAPAATASISTKLGHLYKLSRNKITQDATTLKVYADDGTTVDAKATTSDDGSTYTRSELVTGP